MMAYGDFSVCFDSNINNLMMKSRYFNIIQSWEQNKPLCASSPQLNEELYVRPTRPHLATLAHSKPYAKRNARFARCYLHCVQFNPI